MNKMKKLDRVPREVLYRVYERGDRFFKQKELADACNLSLGTINPLIQKLIRIGILETKPQGFRVVDVKKLLTYWSVTRKLYKDITYTTYMPKRVNKIESDLPANSITTAYTGYKEHFQSTPSDYDKIYIYTDKKTIKKRFKPKPEMKPNIFVLQTDEHLKKLSIGDAAPLPQIYVDLWQLGRPANRFVDELEKKIDQRSIRGLKRIAEEINKKEI